MPASHTWASYLCKTKGRNHCLFFIIPFLPASGEVLLEQWVFREWFLTVSLLSGLQEKSFLFHLYPVITSPPSNKPKLTQIRFGFSKQASWAAPFFPLWNPVEHKKQRNNLEMPYGRCQWKHLCINLTSVLKITGSQNLWLCYLVNNVSRFFSLERPFSLPVAAGHGWIIFSIYPDFASEERALQWERGDLSFTLWVSATSMIHTCILGAVDSIGHIWGSP